MKKKIRKCKVLGRKKSENANPADIEDYMIQNFLKKILKKGINIYEDESWKMHLFILTAIEEE